MQQIIIPPTHPSKKPQLCPLAPSQLEHKSNPSPALGNPPNPLLNLTIKQIQFNNNPVNSNIGKNNPLKPVLPTKIFHQGYYKVQIKNKKMLPSLAHKPSHVSRVVSQHNRDQRDPLRAEKAGYPIRNSRNSEILNSIIQILKSDPDQDHGFHGRNQRLVTEPACRNQFIQTRSISSVKNSRGPKLINNQIMMLGGLKRNLVSEQKKRTRIFDHQYQSLNKPGYKKVDALDQLEMTFYKPPKPVENQFQSLDSKKFEVNQFIKI